MRALVIGTTGQLAFELHRSARPAGVQVSAPQKVDLKDAHAVGTLLEKERPQLVVNAAAYTAVDRAETESELAFAVNAAGAQLLANWCSRNDAALFHVSTDYVFDGRKPVPYVEGDATNPLGVYGASKLAGEAAVRAHLARHVILRTSWVFSAHGQNFVKTMLRLARERDELRVVADQRGCPTSAADLARALLELAGRLAASQELAWGTYHFAGRGETSWHDFAGAILEEQASYTAKRPRLVAISTAEYPTPAKRPANSVLATEHFTATFGIAPASWHAELRGVLRELLRPA